MQWHQSPRLAEHCLKKEVAGFCGFPFVRFKSKILAPMYFDGRMIPGIVPLYKQTLSLYVENWTRYIRPTFSEEVILAGVATGGISMSGMLADRLNLPHCYVRTDKKTHGTKDLIESIGVEGRTVIVFEDVVTRAESSAPVIRILKENGARVPLILSHFSYDFPHSRKAFSEIGTEHFSLMSFEILHAAMRKKFSRDQMLVIDEWYADPDEWTRKMEEKHPSIRQPMFQMSPSKPPSV